MSLAPNEQLFGYRIDRILGQGVFGVVYLARDMLLELIALCRPHCIIVAAPVPWRPAGMSAGCRSRLSG